jgi:hypothetical protein
MQINGEAQIQAGSITADRLAAGAGSSGTPSFMEVLSPVSGSDVAFTSKNTVKLAFALALNGLLQCINIDFTVSGTTWTFSVAPPTGSTVMAWYYY